MSIAMSCLSKLYFRNLKIFNSDYIIKQIIHRMKIIQFLISVVVVCVGLPFITNLQIR